MVDELPMRLQIFGSITNILSDCFSDCGATLLIIRLAGVKLEEK
jgi:hypothetical protein